ncbi:MAG: SDR family NAD(P)-dependent oxidoreductase [Spirochaetia bacterium]|jgi:short-subunit dehydrogenase
MSTDLSAFRRHYGEWALITGGSEGLGAEFARQIAERRLNVVLAARRPELLETVSGDLRRRFGVEVLCVSTDLGKPGAVESLCAEIKELDVGLIVCSAAYSPLGDFLGLAGADHNRLVELNCRVPSFLCWEMGRRMMARHQGGIILISSMAGFQGTGFVAHYAASKAYVRVLAEGLWNELHSNGVDVIASCPGLLRTPTFLDGHPERPPWLASPLMDCSPAVRETLAALGRRPVVIPGRANRISSWITGHLLPRRAAIALASAGTKAMYLRGTSSPV